MEKDLDSLKKCAMGTRVLDMTQSGRAVSSSKKLYSSRASQKSTAIYPRIILTQNVTGQYSFAFRAPDGQLLLTSPFFTDKETILRSLDLLRSLVQIDQLYRICNAGGGQCYFELKNNEGEMLGRSTVYADAQSMQKALTSLKNCAKASRLLDLTGGK